MQHPGEASAFRFGLVNVMLVDYAMSSPLSRERDHWQTAWQTVNRYTDITELVNWIGFFCWEFLPAVVHDR